MKRLLIVLVAALVAACSYSQVSTSISLPDQGHPTFWYGGSVLKDSGYTMWVTVNDAILRFTSQDGTTWQGGARVLEATVPWENDGQGIDAWGGFQHGVSTACVLKLPGGYVMGYMAGPIQNTTTAGGVGLAYSSDGITWVKDPLNPVFSRPGGSSYALSVVVIDRVPWLYVSSADGNLRIPLDQSGHPAGAAVPIAISSPSYPIAWDGTGVWAIEQKDMTPAGWGAFTLYRGGDGTTTLGTPAGEVTQAISGHTAAFMPFLLNRGPLGEHLDGPVVLVYASGNTWATWQLQAVSFGDPVPTPTPTPSLPSIPPPPENVTAHRTDEGCIQVHWSPSPGAVGYSIIRAQLDNIIFGRYVVGFVVPATTFTDCTGLAPGITYYYWIESYGSGGTCFCSTVSASATVPGIRRRLSKLPIRVRVQP